jgi:hypothetical protein
MYDVGGSSFFLGGVLTQTNGAQADVYTDYDTAAPSFTATVTYGATTGNLAEIFMR